MATQELLTLFLASPGDVAPERDIVCKIVEEYNRTVGEANNVRVQVVRWETDARPGWGKGGQAIINQLIEKREHAAFVVLFWNRFGTPTSRAPSGTIEEFRLALKKRLSRLRSGTRPPEIMLYFNTAPATLDIKEMEQRKAVLAFKGSIKDGLYGTYRGKAAFEKQFRIDYGRWLLEEIAVLEKPRRRLQNKTEVAKPAKPAPKPRAPKSSASKDQPLLLDGHLFMARSVVESGNNSQWTLEIRPQTPADDNKLRALCKTQMYHQSVMLAYQLQGGSATIESFNRSSDHSGDLWTLQIRFSPAGYAGYDVNFNGMSADDIAQKRAEWLLLAQKPGLETPSATQSVWGSSIRSNDHWIEAQIMGSGRENEPIFPALWKQFGGDCAKFSAAARLWAVHRLLSNNICQSIEELTVSPVRGGKVSVNFRGRRVSQHGQVSKLISVTNRCALE